MYENISDTLLKLSGAQDDVLVVHRSFVQFTGGLETALMLSQLLYWTPRSRNDGWIAKSDTEFSRELCMTVYGVRASRAILESMGILETEVHKFNGTPTCHYRLRLNELSTLWIQRADSLKTQSPLSENKESLTETTTEITTKTSAKKPRSAEEIRAMTADALFSGIAGRSAQAKGGIAYVKHFPPDTESIVSEFTRLWRISVPSADDARFAYWIKGARALRDACGEFKEELLSELWEELKSSELTISSPASLVNMAAALAGKKRLGMTMVENTSDDSYYWNSNLSEEENIRLMNEKRQKKEE